MSPHLRPALTLFAALSALTGLLYPAVVTALAGALFPEQAEGSLIRRDGEVLGSRLIGQCWDEARWFWGRPSANGCDGAASGGSNLGPSNPALHAAVAARLQALGGGAVPVELVTRSASGLDPDISVEAARWQAPRVAAARGLPEAEVLAIVEAHRIDPLPGLPGGPRLNVLALNLALDAAAPTDHR